MNLAVNARDAMPNAGHLTIETSVVEMDDRYIIGRPVEAVGPFICLAISDTGTGMDEATKARIFDPFFTTKEVGKGTGLGLSTVYGIVQQSSGFIWVYSELGHGTTFKIYLPRTQGEAGTSTADVAPEHRPGTETILVVEDAAGVRVIVHQALERMGYRVLEAPDGATAIAIVSRHAGVIDLLVSDVVMPGMNGRELAEQLVGLRPDLRVLFVSGYTDDAVMRAGLLEGKVHFLQKPFTPEKLLNAVRSVLDG
jgi:CheY-like chemotaxis protein